MGKNNQWGMQYGTHANTNNKEQNNPTWKDWAKEQKHIRDCRIRTQLKWKPQKWTHQTIHRQKKGKTNKQHTPEKHNAQKETQQTQKTRQKQRKKQTMTTPQLQTKPKKNHYGGHWDTSGKYP